VRHSTHPVAQAFAFDLHVLGTPPAFVLSQDQTLRKSCFFKQGVSKDALTVRKSAVQLSKSDLCGKVEFNIYHFIRMSSTIFRRLEKICDALHPKFCAGFVHNRIGNQRVTLLLSIPFDRPLHHWADKAGDAFDAEFSGIAPQNARR
jgi:hypothetical protein